MAKRFSRRITRKKTYKLSPKNAEEVIRQEFTDSRGNRHIFKMDIRPHKPNKPTIEGTVEYKDEQ